MLAGLFTADEYFREKREDTALDGTLSGTISDNFGLTDSIPDDWGDESNMFTSSGTYLVTCPFPTALRMSEIHRRSVGRHMLVAKRKKLLYRHMKVSTQ